MLRIIALMLALLLATACAQEEGGEAVRAFFPDGDPSAGRLAVDEMRCYVCHAVADGSFPEPHASPPVPIALGSNLARMSRGSLVEAIIAPSHRIPEGLEGVRGGELSRMGDYSEAMTVRQLIDIVAYLEALGRG
jgi:hypothetical protein